MRYFDKTFFKFTLGFLVIVAISLMIIYTTSAYAAGVEKIVFTTDHQSIKPNIISLPITIQTQDLGGNLFQTPETIDLEFVSTSATGEFLGSTGNPVADYMSKNTANKTFYYKDSSEGNFTITINAKGRETLVEWSTSQQVIVSSGASDNTTDDNTNLPGEVLGASSSEASSGGVGSATDNVSSLNSQLEILAGSDRTTSPGSPIWFQATVKKNTTKAGPELNWSFGDGNVGVGPLVSHVYKYSGDYVVVLSARAGDIFSVSRLKVKVTESIIEVRDEGEYLEITNNGNTEINLFNWKIENKGKGFIFQPNTIILPKSTVKIDKNLLTMKGLDNSIETSLKNSLGEEVFHFTLVEAIDLNEASKNIEIIKKEAFGIQEKAKNLGLIPQTNSQQANVLGAISVKGEEENEIATNTENVIYEARIEEGILSKLTNFIKRVFSR